MKAELKAKPSTASMPWGLALYSDEVSPSNQLKAENRRNISSADNTTLSFVLHRSSFVCIVKDLKK